MAYEKHTNYRADGSRAAVVFARDVAAAGLGTIEIRGFALASERYHVIA